MKALWLAALLAVPAGAVRPITPPAPDFPLEAGWINSRALPLARMRGRKVIVVAFLNPTGLHSLRLLPVLKAWFDRYALHQLMIVGVVTPDLEIDKDAVWVRSEMKHLGVDFPVIVDGDRRLWKSYANDGWPALYVVDGDDRIVFDRLGEGDYSEIEGEIRAALADVTGSLPDPVEPPEPRKQECGHATDDVDMGARAKKRPIVLGDGDAQRRLLLVGSREGEVDVKGRWDVEPDGLRLAEPNADQKNFARVFYEATQAFGILAPAAGRRTRFFVKLDDGWLYPGIAGKDVRFDDDGRSYVTVDEERLYDLAIDPAAKAHELDVIPETRGGGVYGFSFADACTATALP